MSLKLIGAVLKSSRDCNGFDESSSEAKKLMLVVLNKAG